MIQLPAPWAAMTFEDVEELDEGAAAQLLATISTPRLAAFCAAIPEMRTSALILYMTNHDVTMDKLIPDEVIEEHDGEDVQLIVAAASLALATEIDPPVPR